MAAEAARVLDYDNEYFYGSAAPAREVSGEPWAQTGEVAIPQERTLQRQRARAAEAARSAPGVSMFAVLGALFAAALTVFVVLAQISYNEIASESARLNAQLSELTEQQRRLEITHESVVDMKEVERYARDVLGMSKPEASQVVVFQSAPADRAEVITESDVSAFQGFGKFISSLMEYFRK